MSSLGQTNIRRVSRAKSASKNKVKKPRRKFKTPAFVFNSDDEQELELSQTETSRSSADGSKPTNDANEPIMPSFELPDSFPLTTGDLDELLEVLAETARPTSDPYFPPLTIDEVGELMEAFMETNPPTLVTSPSVMETRLPISHLARRVRKKPCGRQKYQSPAFVVDSDEDSNTGHPPTTSRSGPYFTL